MDGLWIKINEKMIASKGLYKTDETHYQYVYEGEYVKEWAIVDVSIKGKRQSHGVYIINKSYGYENTTTKSTFESTRQHIYQLHQENTINRNQQKVDDINEYINANKNKATKVSGEGS